MQAVRAAVLIPFFLGTFSIRGLQAVISCALAAPVSSSFFVQPSESGYDSDDADPGHPRPDRIVRISRVPRLSPTKLYLASPAVRIYFSIGASLEPKPVARILSESAQDASPACLPQLIAASSAHNRAPPAGLPA